MKIEEFVKKYPGYDIPSQYYKVGNGWETFCCFYNYFDQIFPKDNVPVKMHLFYFGPDGQQVGYGTEIINLHESKQIRTSQFVKEGEGLFVAVAIPEVDIASLAKGKFALRAQISTGYYTMWEYAPKNMIDIHHEWAVLIKGENTNKNEFFSSFSPSAHIIDRRLIIINAHIDPIRGQTIPEYKIFKNSKFLCNYKPGKIMNGRTIQILDLNEIAKETASQFDSNDLITVSVKGENIVYPLTIESLPDQDFHIHHV